ncbi:lantibiotic dehydratase [Streptomyces sp. NPDC057197]|uniref:lantibiotic dehydratase n=1 Tax=Streptomyces sp. NPDC057197 TaxID=3346045 RepID=UPI0036415BFB
MSPGTPHAHPAPVAACPTAGPRSAPPADLLSSPVGVRVAGLPTSALDASRIPRSTELAVRITSLDRRLALDAARLGEELYAVIGTEAARPFKARLVGLRRAVHQGVRIAALLDRAAPPHVLDADLAEGLHRHAALLGARDNLFAELERTLPAETRSAAAALAGLVEDRPFAAGLGYASADLYADVLRWRERARTGRRPLDGAAVRLAKYAARAMAKPSPLTTFAASGFGRWAADAGAAVRLESTARTEVAEASLLPLSRIAAALALLPELDAAVELRVNPWATRVRSPGGDEEWLFTVPGPSGAVRSLPATPALEAILTAVHEAGSPRRLRALLGASGATGDTAVPTGGAPVPTGGAPARPRAATADAVVAQLVRLGLLEVRLGLPDQELDAASLCDWLGERLPAPHDAQPAEEQPTAGRPTDTQPSDIPATEPQTVAPPATEPSATDPRTADRVTLLLADLRAIRDGADAARTAEPGSHGRIAAAMHIRTRDAAHRLGLLGPAGQPEGGTPYFHNTVVTGTAAVLDPAAWRTALADLALVPALLAPFDALAPRREALGRRAATAYGPGFVRPLSTFLKDFGAHWDRAEPNGPDAPASGFATARDARRQYGLRRLISGTAPGPDGTVRLDPRAVRELCATWPEPHTSGDRHTCYVQTLPHTGTDSHPGSPPDAHTGTGLALVLNTVTGGHGTGRTRTARLLGAPHTHPDPNTTVAAPESAQSNLLYAEFDAAFGSALNQRAPATRYAIDLDGSTSRRPPGRLIRPADLDVAHDRHTGHLRLTHRPTGRVVRPLHLGLLATPLLPLPARLLVEVFGPASYTFWSDWPQLWQFLPPDPAAAPSRPGAGTAPGTGWRKMPRLALGSVVLRRATWFVDRGQAPVRAAGERDAAHLVRIHAWRAALGLPRRCFLRVLTPRPAGGFTGPALHDKDRKPVYLDFAHPHLLRVFERAAATDRPLLLTEALPDLHDAPAQRDGHRHAAEFLIELPATTVPAQQRRSETC